MKISVFLAGFVFLSCFSAWAEESPRRELFVSVVQNPAVLSSREAIEELLDFAVRARIHVLYVQVYRANQSWFPSQFADSSPYQACAEKVGTDPLELLIQKAQASGIEVHAWLNLLSLSQNENAPILRKYGKGILAKKRQKLQVLSDWKIDNQYFLEPSDERVQADLSQIIGEVVSRYPGLKGVQLDYIRYPDSLPFYGYSPQNVRRFRESTGRKALESEPAWKNWRRDQVTGLVKRLRERALSIRPSIIVSTTGLAAYSRAFHEGFQDWKKWASEKTADYVTVMTYGQEEADFEAYLEDATKQAADLRSIHIGVGVYRLGGKPAVFEKQWQLCEESGFGGCALFHYESFVDRPELLSFIIPTDKRLLPKK